MLQFITETIYQLRERSRTIIMLTVRELLLQQAVIENLTFRFKNSTRFR